MNFSYFYIDVFLYYRGFLKNNFDYPAKIEVLDKSLEII